MLEETLSLLLGIEISFHLKVLLICDFCLREFKLGLQARRDLIVIDNFARVCILKGCFADITMLIRRLRESMICDILADDHLDLTRAGVFRSRYALFCRLNLLILLFRLVLG